MLMQSVTGDARRSRSGEREAIEYVNAEDMLQIFPPVMYRKFEWALSLLVSGTWQDRRVACTESVLAFSLPDKEKLLDVIPLSDINGVQDMGGLRCADVDDNTARIQLEITIYRKSRSWRSSTFFSRRKTRAADEKEICRRAFESIDTDQKGSCTIDRLIIWLKNMCYSIEEIENAISSADAGRTGEVTFDEFWDIQHKINQGKQDRKVKVKVIKAENVLNTGGQGTPLEEATMFWYCSDPYVELSCGKKSKKTKVVYNNQNPEFNETFKFSVIPFDQILTLKLWDHDSVRSDNLLGTLEIPLIKLKAGETYSQWYKIGSPNKTCEEEDDLYANALQIRTAREGYNMGRKYFIKADSPQSCELVARELSALISRAKKRADTRTWFEKSQASVKRLYDTPLYLNTISFLLILTFVLSCLMTQYASALDRNGDGSYDGEMELVGTLINYVLSGIFALELAISLYAHWWRPFFTSGWKIFDLVIVIVSLLALTSWTPIPPEVARAMRIFRVFGTAESLRRIISPLVASIIPVANAFAILFVVVAFGAIVAVNLFGEVDPDHFEVFDKAFITLFFVTAGDPWPDTLPKLREDGTADWVTAGYVIVFTVTVVWIFVEVSVAILLENFIKGSQAREQSERLHHILQYQEKHLVQHPLEPLLRKLIKGYVDDKDLNSKLLALFQAVTLNIIMGGNIRSGPKQRRKSQVTCCLTPKTTPNTYNAVKYAIMPEPVWETPDDFCAALKRLEMKPRIHLTPLEFDSITNGRSLCDSRGNIGPTEFCSLMLREMRFYMQGRLTEQGFSEHRTPEDTEFTNLAATKMMLTEQISLASGIQTILDQLDSSKIVQGSQGGAGTNLYLEQQSAGGVYCLPKDTSAMPSAAKKMEVLDAADAPAGLNVVLQAVLRGQEEIMKLVQQAVAKEAQNAAALLRIQDTLNTIQCRQTSRNLCDSPPSDHSADDVQTPPEDASGDQASVCKQNPARIRNNSPITAPTLPNSHDRFVLRHNPLLEPPSTVVNDAGALQQVDHPNIMAVSPTSEHGVVKQCVSMFSARRTGDVMSKDLT